MTTTTAPVTPADLRNAYTVCADPGDLIDVDELYAFLREEGRVHGFHTALYALSAEPGVWFEVARDAAADYRELISID